MSKSDKPGHWPYDQVEPFLAYLEGECGLAHNTILAYRRDLKRFCSYCTDWKVKKAADINPVILQDYAKTISQDRLSTASVARNLVAVKMFLRFHLLTGLLKEDVCSVMESPKTWQRIPKTISQKQTVSLITAVDDEDPLYTRDRALLETLYATGMRASEAADLNLSDLNFQIGYIRCFGKGKKERIVPINQSASAALKDYLEIFRSQRVRNTKETHLFVSRTGRPLNRIEVWRIVRKAAIRAGLGGRISPHTLRHCFGSHLLAGGADLRVVQELLGHADVTTTQIYTHVDQQHLRAIHKKYHPRG